MRVNCCVRTGLLAVGAGFAMALGAGAQTLATGDSRTVTEPVIPPSCAVLASQMAIVSGGPASETAFDTTRIQAALTACPSGQAVELTAAGTNNAFLIQPLTIPSGVGLVVDGGVTVFASRNPADYQTASTELCGTIGASGNGCNVLLNFAKGTGSGLYGYGVIDARGGSTMLGGPNPGMSWWTNADNAGTASLSQDNPIIMKPAVNNFVLYKITLRNSPEFHVGWSGSGFTAWGVKISAPFTAHNTDGIDPDGTNVTITNSSISDGDDDVAVGASSTSANVTVSNVNTYSGHGISVGSYTQGGLTNMLVNGVNMAGTAQDGNATGIRLKSSEDRGGVLQTITYENMCVKDIHNILQLNPFYNTNTGTLIPSFQNVVLQNVHFLTPTVNTLTYLVYLQGHDANHISTITLNNVVFDQLSSSWITPAPQYDAFTLMGNVYPALLQNLTGTGVTYSGTATATAGAGVSSCTGVFPYIVGEMYASTATATNLKTATIAKNASVTLNAMVEPAMSQTTYAGTGGTWTGVAAPSAAVNFYEGTTLLGTGTLSGNGTLAALTLSNVTSGTHTYTATYPGDSNYQVLPLGTVTVNVTTATTATTTVLTAPSTGTFGNSVTLSAAVTGAGGTPTGTVAFYDGTASLGSATLAGGAASLTVSFAGGTHSLSAVYSGDSTYVASTSTSSTLTMATVSSSTAVTANPTTVSQNFTTVLKATVTGLSGQAKPTGTVSFTIGTTSLGNAALNSSGVGTLTATLTTTGPQTITASYGGDGNYGVSSGMAAVTVTNTTTTTALTAATTAVYGVAQTFSVKVTGSTGTTGTPTGTVSFYDGTNLLGSATLASGAGSLTGQVLTGGAHSLTAVYSGDSNFPGSTSTATTETVTLAPSSTSLSISPSNTPALAQVSLTATVNGAALGAVPTGIVTFSDGATVLGTGVLTGNTATLAVGLPNAGTRTITASYSGDTNYAVSSGTSGATVTALATATTVKLSTSTAYGGQTVTVTATVTPATYGTVTFLADGTSIGTATVNASGVATFAYTLPVSTVGSVAITASYAAGGAYAGSSSTVLTLTAATAFLLSPSSNPLSVTHGSSGTLTLSVAPGGGFTGAVALTCASPVSYVTCTIAPTSVTISGTTAATATATIAVAATTSSLFGVHSNAVWAMLGPLGLLGLAFGTRRRKMLVRVALMLLMAAVSVGVVSGCSSSTSSSTSSTSNVPSGTQQVTFTATVPATANSAAIVQTITVAVNIQ